MTRYGGSNEGAGHRWCRVHRREPRAPAPRRRLRRGRRARRPVDRVATTSPASTWNFVEGSILDADTARLVPRRRSHAIVHLAARPSVPRSIEDPVASHEANATGTVEVLEAARAAAGGGHVIVASSSSVYGANPTLPKHEGLVPMPASPYAVSKLATESYTLAYRRCFALPVLAFRFFNVFGPLQAAGHAYAAVIPAFVDAALRGEPLTVHGDGTQSRDFTYVGTVTEVIADALARRVDHDGPVNLAFGTRTDLLSVIAKLEGILGTAVERNHTPTGR
ncbi:MAG: NAD-dependent epimerase/dehydratase family protein [Microthrixaceae bacterium]